LKALVFGAEGQLGSQLVRLLGPETRLTHAEASITDGAAVAGAIESRKPDVVFNCAAYNAVDGAETHAADAFAVNADGPKHMAIACRKGGALLVHFSTNFVFDGSHDEPYVEADEPAPRSVYAQSKLEGERLALEFGARVLVVRTAAVYGGPKSFPMRILDRARSGEPLRVVSDQRVNPTYARDLADLALRLAGDGVAGIVHGVAEGCCSWDEFARAALEAASVKAPVESIATGDYPAAAERPLNGCLASTRIAPLRPWRDALHDALNP
jgi:dTDP-4-dehydrorhamnose reductase